MVYACDSVKLLAIRHYYALCIDTSHLTYTTLFRTPSNPRRTWRMASNSVDGATLIDSHPMGSAI